MPEPLNDDVEDVLDDLPGDPADGEEDKTDWKKLAQERHGIAKRFKTKLGKAKDELKKAKPAAESGDGNGQEKSKQGNGAEKKGSLDRVDKAVLRTEKITHAEDIELVESIMKETGKDLEAVLESKYFQGELKSLREVRATKDATPDGTRRSGTGSRDSVDYWLAKGELPPMDQPELRRKVVNAKMAKEKSGNNFSSNPIS